MRVLKNRNFAILFSGQLVSTLGNSLYGIALPWFVYVMTGSKQDLAIAGIAQTLPGLAGLFAGVFVDRWRKRTAMIASDAVRAALAGLLFAAVLAHAAFWWLIALVLVLQLVGTVFQPAAAAFLPLVVADADIPEASGVNQSGGAVAQLIGYLSGGALITLLGAPILFLCDAVSFVVSAISLGFVRTRPDAPADGANRHPSFFVDWLEGLRLLGKSRFLLILMAGSLVVNFSLAPIDLALTAWVKGPLHGTGLDLGVVNGMFFVGIIAGGFMVGPLVKHINLRVLFAAGSIGTGLAAGSFGLMAFLWWSCAAALVAGSFIGAMNGASMALFVRLIPAAVRGRIFGIMGALGTVAMPVGMGLFGVLVTQMSLTALFAAMGALCAFCGALLLLPIQDDLQAAFQSADAVDVTA